MRTLTENLAFIKIQTVLSAFRKVFQKFQCVNRELGFWPSTDVQLGENNFFTPFTAVSSTYVVDRELRVNLIAFSHETLPFSLSAFEILYII